MPIPNTPAEALQDAMGRFDRDLRRTPDWAKWEQNRAYRYAIEHNGQRYPVKQIVSMAIGMPVSEFSGGEAAGDANQYVATRGFAIIELPRRNPTWVRDELILALDLYLRLDGKSAAEQHRHRRAEPNLEPPRTLSRDRDPGPLSKRQWRLYEDHEFPAVRSCVH